ncbi:hypothetical protein GCM10009609_32770 [Pseudonocardia aurantiaca]
MPWGRAVIREFYSADRDRTIDVMTFDEDIRITRMRVERRGRAAPDGIPSAVGADQAADDRPELGGTSNTAAMG